MTQTGQVQQDSFRERAQERRAAAPFFAQESPVNDAAPGTGGSSCSFSALTQPFRSHARNDVQQQHAAPFCASDPKNAAAAPPLHKRAGERRPPARPALFGARAIPGTRQHVFAQASPRTTPARSSSSCSVLARETAQPFFCTSRSHARSGPTGSSGTLHYARPAPFSCSLRSPALAAEGGGRTLLSSLT